MKKHFSYTFSGWLRFVKKLSQKEIDLLWDSKSMEDLHREYQEYLDGLEEGEEDSI